MELETSKERAETTRKLKSAVIKTAKTLPPFHSYQEAVGEIVIRQNEIKEWQNVSYPILDLINFCNGRIDHAMFEKEPTFKDKWNGIKAGLYRLHKACFSMLVALERLDTEGIENEKQ